MKRRIICMLGFCCLCLPGHVVMGQGEDLTVIPTTGYERVNASGSAGGFHSVGNAAPLGALCYRLTEATFNQAGQIWWSRRVNLRENFRMDFVIYAGDIDGDGADGFAFIMHNSPQGHFPVGRNGQDLGIGGIEPSLAVEIDTWENHEPNFVNSCTRLKRIGRDYGGQSGTALEYHDPVNDHLALVVNGVTGCPLHAQTLDAQGNLQSTLVPHVNVYTDPMKTNVENNRACPNFTIVWDYLSPTRQRMRVFVDKKLRLLREYDFIGQVFKGKDKVFWGYTGSTGAHVNEQVICLNYEIRPQPKKDNVYVPPRTFDIEVLQNDLEGSLYSDLWIYKIVLPPKKGTATITPDLTKVRYTPNSGSTEQVKDSLKYRVCDNPNGDRCYTHCADTTVVMTISCIDAQFTASSVSGCVPLEVVFRNTSHAESAAYSWDFDDKNSWKQNQSKENIKYNFNTPGTYTIRLKGEDANACLGSVVATKKISVHPNPSYSISPKQSICQGDSVQLYATGGVKYAWTPDVGLSNAALANPVARPATTTTYQVAITGVHCNNQLEAIVQVNAQPRIASMEVKDVTTCQGAFEHRFTANVQQAGSFVWDMGDGKRYDNIRSITHKYAQVGTYKVRLEAQTDICYALQSKEVRVKDLFVPNVLTPNGDGRNDYFAITSAQPVKVSIFDRNGMSLYSQENYQNDWNGDKLPGGIYFYNVISHEASCNGWLHLIRDAK